MRSVKTMGETAENRRYAQTSERGNWFIAMALPVLVMFALIFTAFNLRISFTQKSEVATRGIARAKVKIYQLEREISNLKNRKEELSSWPKIRDKIALYRLGLREPDPGQMVRIELPGELLSAEQGNGAAWKNPARRTASADL